MSVPSLIELLGRVSLKQTTACLRGSVVQTGLRTTQQAHFATKAKAEEDSQAPKRPVNSYIWFCKDYRGELAKKGTLPKLSKDATSLCAVAWQGASPADRKKYELRYTEDKTRYKRELEVYKQSLPPEKPGRSKSGYNFFISDLAKRNPKMSFKVNSSAHKFATNKWNGMTAFQKGPYNAKSRQDATDKLKQLELYKQSLPVEKPKRPTSAYNFYTAEMLSGANKVDMQESARQWNSLGDTQRAAYVRKAAEAREKYEQELREWEAMQE